MLDSTKSHHVYLGSAVNKLTIKSALHFQKKKGLAIKLLFIKEIFQKSYF